MPQGWVVDEELMDLIIQERKRRGIDVYDEVWSGVYVIPPPPNLDQQELVGDLATIFHDSVKKQGRGTSYTGINVSDRRTRWEDNYRCPDVVVVLQKSRAVNCKTHYYLGPDFLVEIDSPGNGTEEKIPFYSKVGVRELLIIDRDSRRLRLLRHGGADLIEVKPTALEGKQWLVSEVLPLAFRRSTSKGVARTEVRRTDCQPGAWTI